MSVLKLIFDECLPEPMLAKLRPLLESSGAQVELAHVTTYLRQGIPDAEWIPRIASEGWIVITADRGNIGCHKSGRKLPELCDKFCVAHVLITPAIGQMSGFEKARFIVSTWPQMLQLKDVPRGSRFRLRLNTTRTTAVIEAWQKPESSENGSSTPIPESLFPAKTDFPSSTAAPPESPDATSKP